MESFHMLGHRTIYHFRVCRTCLLYTLLHQLFWHSIACLFDGCTRRHNFVFQDLSSGHSLCLKRSMNQLKFPDYLLLLCSCSCWNPLVSRYYIFRLSSSWSWLSVYPSLISGWDPYCYGTKTLSYMSLAFCLVVLIFKKFWKLILSWNF